LFHIKSKAQSLLQLFDARSTCFVNKLTENSYKIDLEILECISISIKIEKLIVNPALVSHWHFTCCSLYSLCAWNRQSTHTIRI